MKRIDKLKQELITLPEKILPFVLYRYIVFLCKKIKFIGKEWPYTEEFFLKWHPFSRKKYYVIRWEYQTSAHFSAARNYLAVAENVKYKGMQPLIVLQWRSDIKKRDLCLENEWENIFRQKKMQDVLNERATILVSKLYVTADVIMKTSKFASDINGDSADYTIHATETNWRSYYKNVHKYVRRYWLFKQSILAETQKSYTQMFRPEENVLGVALREVFSEEYNDLVKNRDAKKRYRAHPLGPNVNEILDIVEACLEKWNCDKIFVASRFSDSIEKFEKRFPGKIICCERERQSMVDVAEELNSRQKFIEESMGEDVEFRNRSHRIAKEYVQETLLLSKCSYLIGAKSGQTIAALALNGGRYKDVKVLEDKHHISRY